MQPQLKKLLTDLALSELTSALHWRQIALDAIRRDDMPMACFAHGLAVQREEEAEHDLKEAQV